MARPPASFIFGGQRDFHNRNQTLLSIAPSASQLLNTQELFLELWETLQEPAFSQTCLPKAGLLLSLAGMHKLRETRISSCGRFGFNEERKSTCNGSKFIWWDCGLGEVHTLSLDKTTTSAMSLCIHQLCLLVSISACCTMGRGTNQGRAGTTQC